MVHGVARDGLNDEGKSVGLDHLVEQGFRLIFTNLFRDDVGAYVGSHRGVNLHM